MHLALAHAGGIGSVLSVVIQCRRQYAVGGGRLGEQSAWMDVNGGRGPGVVAPCVWAAF